MQKLLKNGNKKIFFIVDNQKINYVLDTIDNSVFDKWEKNDCINIYILHRPPFVLEIFLESEHKREEYDC